MNFYKRYMGDYGRSTGHLSLQDHGAYTLLLDHYYSSKTALPADIDSIRRICGAITESETESVIRVLDKFFPIKPDGLRHNKRCDEEIGKWNAQASVNKEVGKLGGRPKKTESVTESITEQKPSPEARSQKPEVRSQTPEFRNQKKQSQNPSDSASRRGPQKGNGSAKTHEAESAYREAIQARYGSDPGALNGRQRGMLVQFLNLVPLEEVASIIKHYVASNRGYYVSRSHCINLLLRDAESLRMSCRNGSSITDTEARQGDRTQANYDAFAPLIAEAREREKNGTK